MSIFCGRMQYCQPIMICSLCLSIVIKQDLGYYLMSSPGCRMQYCPPGVVCSFCLCIVMEKDLNYRFMSVLCCKMQCCPFIVYGFRLRTVIKQDLDNCRMSTI